VKTLWEWQKRRAKDFMHKLTTEMVRELKESNSGAIIERIRGIKQRVLNSSKEHNGKLSKWTRIQAQMAWTAGKIRGREEYFQDLSPCSGYLVAHGGG
jgi:IS605 OrfB family transposase